MHLFRTPYEQLGRGRRWHGQLLLLLVGGGGRGGSYQRGALQPGQANSGDRGGEANGYGVTPLAGSAVGSGVVIIRYPIQQTPPYNVMVPFTLSNCCTGSTELTNTNRVMLFTLPIPAGCDASQFTTDDPPALVNAAGWSSTSVVPDALTFDVPEPDGELVDAWFTNTLADGPLLRADARIMFAAEKRTEFTGSASMVDVGHPEALQLDAGSPVSTFHPAVRRKPMGC